MIQQVRRVCLGRETETPGWRGQGEDLNRALSDDCIRSALSLQISPLRDGIRQSRCKGTGVTMCSPPGPACWGARAATGMQQGSSLSVRVTHGSLPWALLALTQVLSRHPLSLSASPQGPVFITPLPTQFILLCPTLPSLLY